VAETTPRGPPLETPPSIWASFDPSKPRFRGGRNCQIWARFDPSRGVESGQIWARSGPLEDPSRGVLRGPEPGEAVRFWTGRSCLRVAPAARPDPEDLAGRASELSSPRQSESCESARSRIEFLDCRELQNPASRRVGGARSAGESVTAIHFLRLHWRLSSDVIDRSSYQDLRHPPSSAIRARTRNPLFGYEPSARRTLSVPSLGDAICDAVFSLLGPLEPSKLKTARFAEDYPFGVKFP
jgi:hypothetical protein